MSQQAPRTVVDVHQQMADMVFSYCISQLIRAIADLAIADHLSEGGMTAAEVAEREGSAPDSTARVMRAAVAIGLLTADGEGRFHGTPLLDTLRTDAPGSLRGLALGATNLSHWVPWQEFTGAVRAGHSQARATLGMTFFEYLKLNPDQAREFSADMTSLTSLWAGDVVKVLDTTNVTRAVDVGGSTGSLLVLLQEANPALQGVIFDLPDVAQEVVADVARTEFGKRTEVLGGNFFEAVPPADLYLLKFILHDWDDDSCVEILSRCREAMTPGGRIAIVEMIVGDHIDPGRQATVMDLQMLALTNGGRERSLKEYDALLIAADLRRTLVRTTSSPFSVIEAEAA
jgi:hypothetical protein